jgi:predicted RNase H-like HicB family nuclease
MEGSMKYHALYERSNDGSIWGYCPDLPGVSGAGDTLEGARESLRAGLSLWFDEARAAKLAIPEPSFIASELIEISIA